MLHESVQDVRDGNVDSVKKEKTEGIHAVMGYVSSVGELEVDRGVGMGQPFFLVPVLMELK